MILEVTPERPSVVQRLDPRIRILLAVAASVYPLFVHSIAVLCACVAGALVLCAAARVAWPKLALRIAALNAFMAILVVFLPWSVPGQPLIGLGPWFYSWEGLTLTAQIALRAHAIIVALTALIGGMEPVTFGHALEHLRLPRKLIQLFLFTVRYIAVLEREYLQLRRAMAVRAFEPKFDLHTLKTFGNLIGMLLVRALDRSERIDEAMRCRGFTGRYPSFHHFQWGARDVVVSFTLLACVGAALAIEWIWPLH